MDKTSNPVETERSNMLRGELYSAMDPELVAARVPVVGLKRPPQV